MNKEVKNLIKAAKAYIKKVEEIENSDEFLNVFLISEIHGYPYEGKSASDERVLLKKAIEKVDGL